MGPQPPGCRFLLSAHPRPTRVAMKNRSVVCIDLGSSYTKIAVRRDWNEDSELLRELPLADRQVDFCIPSVVARIDRGGHREWAVGAEAAALAPREDVRVYRYWKARLFSPEDAAQGAGERLGGSPRAPDDDYDQVAVRFFRGIRESLKRLPLDLDLRRTPVRVCVPKLESGEDPEPRISRLLERAGLHPAKGRATVYEPESNACGVFTRARNATWIPPRVSFLPSPGRSLQLREMLEPEGLMQAFRRMSGSFGVLVIDIGGFTTDFGYVQFDTSFRSEDWQRPDIVQRSYELGIRELDQAVHEGLGEEARQAVEALSAGEWDACKARLYGGEPVTLRTPAGREVRAGTGEDLERIDGAMREFAARVNRARDHFLETSVRGPVNVQTLTGGGAMIAPIREVVARALAADDGARVYDLLDEDEPRRTLLQRDGFVDERAVEARARRNLELVRGGSAIGGSSVFFE